MSKPSIAKVQAWEALDSRGRPTVGCRVQLADGTSGDATVPAGASTGRHEARELRDGGPRYDGGGVRAAVANIVGPLAAAVRGMDVTDQPMIDRRLREVDGSPDLRNLGANAVLAVSVASAVAAAAGQRMPLFRAVGRGERGLLPRPMVNIVSGGAHAGGVIDIQDVLAVPLAADTVAEAIEVAARVRAQTACAAEERGQPVHLVADEGGLGLPLGDNQAAIGLVLEGIERAGFRPGEDVGIALDVAAAQLQVGTAYRLRTEGREVDADELIDELQGWCRRYPIVSVEDGLGEDAWGDWATLTRSLPGVQVLGDDLFVTDVARLRQGIACGAANAVLVKPNQIGTLTDARAVVELAHEAGYRTVLSARSGDTEDAWLADLAIGWRTGQLKVGSTHRAERTAKWNRLLAVEATAGAGELDAGLASWPLPLPVPITSPVGNGRHI